MAKPLTSCWGAMVGAQHSTSQGTRAVTGGGFPWRRGSRAKAPLRAWKLGLLLLFFLQQVVLWQVREKRLLKII